MTDTTETETSPAANVDTTPRYDMLIVSTNRAYTVVEQGLRAFINYLQVSNVIRMQDEAVAKEWTELYAKPGPTAHEAFIKGAYTGTKEPYLECCIRADKNPFPLPYGGEAGETSAIRFYLEFRGCLFQDLAPRFKNRLREVLYTRFDIYTRPHTALPPHLIVANGDAHEKPEMARKDSASPRVGTAVEEF